MQIWIKNTSTGDSTSFDVEPTFTVEQIVELIAKNNYPKKYLLQLVSKNILDNPKATLEELQVEDDFTLNLIPEGSEYPVEPQISTNPKKVEEAKVNQYETNEQKALLPVPSNLVNVQDINIENGGIVVFGNCGNPKCKLHSKLIREIKGYGDMQIPNGSKIEVLCPDCGVPTATILRNVFAHNCEYNIRIEGQPLIHGTTCCGPVRLFPNNASGDITINTGRPGFCCYVFSKCIII
jgi:hypothetical protein